MHDRPTQSELLDIIAETLSDVVVPATAPHAQHQARVAANLCRILSREQQQPATFEAALRRLELELDLPIGQGGLDGITEAISTADVSTAERIHEAVAELVRQKLAVVKPGHDLHDAEAESRVIA